MGVIVDNSTKNRTDTGAFRIPMAVQLIFTILLVFGLIFSKLSVVEYHNILPDLFHYYTDPLLPDLLLHCQDYCSINIASGPTITIYCQWTWHPKTARIIVFPIAKPN
jgi:hypothetical protein